MDVIGCNWWMVVSWCSWRLPMKKYSTWILGINCWVVEFCLLAALPADSGLGCTSLWFYAVKPSRRLIYMIYLIYWSSIFGIAFCTSLYINWIWNSNNLLEQRFSWRWFQVPTRVKLCGSTSQPNNKIWNPETKKMVSPTNKMTNNHEKMFGSPSFKEPPWTNPHPCRLQIPLYTHYIPIRGFQMCANFKKDIAIAL